MRLEDDIAVIMSAMQVHTDFIQNVYIEFFFVFHKAFVILAFEIEDRCMSDDAVNEFKWVILLISLCLIFGSS